jgi:hypothetical protein
MEKFLELLAETTHKHSGNWQIYWHGAIRFTTSVYKLNMACPIELVYFDKFGDSEIMKHPQKRGVELGLSVEEAIEVIKAADNDYGHDRNLRGKILEVVGLT